MPVDPEQIITPEGQSGSLEPAPPVQHNSAEVSWTASEYISHQKSSSWYLILTLIGLGVAAAVFLFTRDKISTVMMLLVAIAFGVFASRQPRTLSYRIDDSGLQIENKHYPFEMFKSFSIDDDGPIASIYLTPLKRFMPGLTIYFPPEHEEAIIMAFGEYLPHEERPPDTLDKLMRKIRF